MLLAEPKIEDNVKVRETVEAGQTVIDYDADHYMVMMETRPLD